MLKLPCRLLIWSAWCCLQSDGDNSEAVIPLVCSLIVEDVLENKNSLIPAYFSFRKWCWTFVPSKSDWSTTLRQSFFSLMSFFRKLPIYLHVNKMTIRPIILVASFLSENIERFWGRSDVTFPLVIMFCRTIQSTSFFVPIPCFK